MRVLLTIASQLSRIACIAGVVFLAYHEKNGWGWLLLLTFFAGVSITTETSKKSD